MTRIEEGIKRGSTNAVLIKVNQIGTLTDTYHAVKAAVDSGQTPVMSHRSGETTDETIAHLAVGFGCPVIKTGVVGGERIAKLNELLRIAEELGPESARMAKPPL
ncbi:enolase [archaeon BMS3Bbin16]|nr:enolase [archaeon BMS3Bbin16]